MWAWGGVGGAREWHDGTIKQRIWKNRKGSEVREGEVVVRAIAERKYI